MLSILELPSVRRQAKPIDVRTYHWMGEQGLVDKRTELIQGVIIEKMSKSPLHSSIARVLLEICQNAVPADHVVTKEDPLTLADSEPEPDLAIVHGKIEDFKLRHPATAELVIEVAVSSAELDREKALIYAAANIPEYWLVLPEKKTLEIFSHPIEGQYTRHRVLTSSDIASAECFPKLSVSLGDLFQ